MNQILTLIREEQLGAEARLPSERKMEQMLKSTRPTINKAVACLIAKGHLRREGYKLRVSTPPANDSSAPVTHMLCPHAEYQRVTLVRHDLVEAAHDVANVLHTQFVPVLARTAAEQRQQLTALLETGTHGFVIWPMAPMNDLLSLAQQKGIPFVVTDFDHESFNFVGTDNEAGERLAVQHLAQMGHRELAYVTASLRLSSLQRRSEGYVQACHAAGLGESVSRIIEIGAITAEEVHAGLRKLKSQYPQVTAIACSNDLLALHAMDAVRKVGKQVPRDLSVIGFDDVDAAALSNPPLTTIAQDFYQLGVVAVELLYRQLRLVNDSTVRPCRLRLEPRLIVRQSVRQL